MHQVNFGPEIDTRQIFIGPLLAMTSNGTTCINESFEVIQRRVRHPKTFHAQGPLIYFVY